MGKLGFLAIALFLVLELTFAAESPAPAPSLGADSPPPAPSLGVDSPPQLAPTPYAGSPDSSPSISPVAAASPPAPFPSDLEQGKSPSSSPAPSPTGESDVNHSNINADKSEEMTGNKGGMSGGRKAGIVVAVVVAACLVGFGGLVYKKRRDNIRRSQYGYDARRELL
ncbi:hypothetical protein DITRI_Ditri14bG0081600 [Diplodiscus trichospermus]